MTISFEVDDLVHIAELLRRNLHESDEMLEENPLDIEAAIDLEKSKSCLIKITLGSIKLEDKKVETTDAILFQGRPSLN